MISMKLEDYTTNSANILVRKTLKHKLSLPRHHGFGLDSCCAAVEYKPRAHGEVHYSFGNSQLHVPVMAGYYARDYVKLHAEVAAIAIALDRCLNNGPVPITAVYVELSPCNEKCKQALDNILPDGTLVYYSFIHPRQVNQWRQAVRALAGY